MSAGFDEILIELPATQFVRVEASGKEQRRSVQDETSFLLSKWVLSTRHGEANGEGRSE